MSQPRTTPKPILIARSDMPDLFGVSSNHFSRLQSAGVFAPATKGMYDLKASIDAWLEYKTGGDTDRTLTDEKRLLVIAQRRKLEQEIKARDKELVELAAIEQFFLANVQALASALDGVAGRLAFEVAAITDPAQVRAILLQELRLVRETYANALENSLAGSESRATASTASPSDSNAVG